MYLTGPVDGVEMSCPIVRAALADTPRSTDPTTRTYVSNGLER